jgi:hypothetical protein
MKVSVRGWKSKDREVDLGRLTVLSGPNGSGKSAIVDGIRYAALGYVPSAGRTVDSVAGLMRGGECEVRLTLDDGSVITRGLVAGEDGFRRVAASPWAPPGRTSEHEARIVEQFGRTAAEAEECLDIRGLLNASPQERAGRVAALLAAGRKPASERLAEIARDTISRLVDLPVERIPVEYLKALPMVAEGHRAALKTVAPDLESIIAVGGVSGCIEWCNAQKNDAARILKEKEAAKVELEREVAALPQEVGAEAVERLEDDRSRIEQAIGGERASSQQAMQLVNCRKSALADYAARKKQYAGATKNLKSLLGGKDVGEIEASLLLLTGRLDSIRKCMVPASVEESGIEDDYERVKKQYEAGKKDPWHEVRDLGTCLSNMRHAEIARVGRRLVALAKANAGRYPRAVDVTKAKQAIEAVRKLEAKYDSDRLKCSRLEKEQGRLHDLADRISSANEAVIHAKAALDHAEKRLNELPDANPYSMDRLMGLEASLRDVSGRLKAIADAAALRRELKRLLNAIKGSEALRDVYVALEWGLQRARERVLAEDRPVLVDRMKAFFRGAGIDALPFFSVGKNRVMFGMSAPDGTNILVETLSGGEWVLFVAALTAAVISIRRPKVGILIVEAGEVDTYNLDRLLRGIEGVMDGGLSAAIVCTQQHIGNIGPVWNVRGLTHG